MRIWHYSAHRSCSVQEKALLAGSDTSLQTFTILPAASQRMHHSTPWLLQTYVTHLVVEGGTQGGHAIELHLLHQVASRGGVPDAIALHIAVHETHLDAIIIKQARHLRAHTHAVTLVTMSAGEC